jgi:hypothetical protein
VHREFYDPGAPVLEFSPMSAAALSKRFSWLAMAGLAQAIGVALLPKCPFCLAMDFGIAGTLLAALQRRFGPLLWPSLALAAVSAAMLFRRSRLRDTGAGTCCPF